MINASESKQNKQEESCTVILPQKVFLVLGDQNIDQWLRPVNALLQIWRYGRLEKWGTLFACLLQIATSVNEPLVYLLQMLSLRLYVRIKEKSNYLRWYDEESFRIKTHVLYGNNISKSLPLLSLYSRNINFELSKNINNSVIVLGLMGLRNIFNG